jgi:hypothetical protein
MTNPNWPDNRIESSPPACEPEAVAIHAMMARAAIDPAIHQTNWRNGSIDIVGATK